VLVAGAAVAAASVAGLMLPVSIVWFFRRNGIALFRFFLIGIISSTFIACSAIMYSTCLLKWPDAVHGFYSCGLLRPLPHFHPHVCEPNWSRDM
jgi:hypothetical protein